VKIVPFEIDLNGHAHHWIVIHDENLRHTITARRGILPGLSVKIRVLLHAGLLPSNYSHCVAFRRRRGTAQLGVRERIRAAPLASGSIRRTRVSFRWSLRIMAVSLIALRFSIANQCTNLISAANMTACLPSKVYKMRGTPHPLTQLHSQAEAS
jgi:hypothetical protein